jgi:hypothetical protein
MRLDDCGMMLHGKRRIKVKTLFRRKEFQLIAIRNTFYLDGKKVTIKIKPLTIEAYKLEK